MSSRIVASEILALIDLVNAPGGNKAREDVSVDEIQQFVKTIEMAGGAGTISFTIDPDQCAVVVSIEDLNISDASPKDTTISHQSQAVTELDLGQSFLASDLLLVFPSGIGQITLALTPEAGKTGYARAVGYYLPKRAYNRLQSIGTRVL